MADLSPVFNELLLERNSKEIDPDRFTIEHVNDFLKEAYQINTRIAESLRYLRSIRRPYLSTAPPPRTSRFSKTPVKHSRNKSRDVQDEPQYLSDKQRDNIDTEVKATLRDINAAITQLSKAEQTRQQTETALTQRKRRKKGFGALSSWAAGGVEEAKTPEEQEEDAKASTIAENRKSVIEFLSMGSRECGDMQTGMLEIRASRDIEKGKSALADVRGPLGSRSTMGGCMNTAVVEEQQSQDGGTDPQLSAEQQQLFAEENKNMLKLYEDRRAQVRQTEKSLLEISELQSTLVANLDQQAVHIEHLVQDSFQTAEDVSKGNKQLNEASQRKSTAKMVFYSSCALSAFLVLWDLII